MRSMCLLLGRIGSRLTWNACSPTDLPEFVDHRLVDRFWLRNTCWSEKRNDGEQKGQAGRIQATTQMHETRASIGHSAKNAEYARTGRDGQLLCYHERDSIGDQDSEMSGTYGGRSQRSGRSETSRQR